MFECGPVYHANLNAEEDIIINQGGTDSGKTYAIMQVLFTIATKEPPPTEDAIITIVGESVPNLKKGPYRTAKSIYGSSTALQRRVQSWNETDRMVYFKNGWVMEFTSYETEQQAKQGKRQYCFFNEPNNINWNVFWQVAKRTRKKTFIDYNPSAPFWAHDKLIGTNPTSNDLSATVKLIISDHRHNPFLSEKEHARTEGIKDKDLWKVYARGMTGNLVGLIYTNWKEIPDEDFPNEDGVFYGIDFGYENDPTAIVKCVRVANSIYIHEIAYQSGDIPPRNIVQLMKANGYTKEPIYCEHDPDQIAQLRRLQVSAYPARKGVGSIKAGIQKVKEFKIFYTSGSVNIKEEIKRYMWMIDPDTGKPTNEPKPGWDHCFVGNTKIITTEGYRNIEDLREGDEVLTQYGINKIVKKFSNGYKEVRSFNITFSDHENQTLTCTPDHKIYTKEKGWLPIAELKPGMTVIHFKPSMERNTSYIKEKSISPRGVKGSMLLYMNIILARLKKAATFTTWMKINTITTPQTLSKKTGLNIFQSICKRWIKGNCASAWTTPGYLLQDGTGALKQKNGTENKAHQHYKRPPKKTFSQTVSNAVVNILNLWPTIQSVGFAPKNVKPNGEEIIKLTTLKENVLFAQKSFLLTDIQRQERVVIAVQQSNAGKKEVFDLMVENDHSYFAENILVHNCLDAIRYAIYTHYYRVSAS